MPTKSTTYNCQYDFSLTHLLPDFYYISGPITNIAVYIRKNGAEPELYYTITDHLGSIVAITDTNGEIIEEQRYNPWGVYRNAQTGAPEETPQITMLYRGYTGHEMLPEFGLINMNGRLYDPVIARVLSPDNNVQNPNNPQNYNRYSYCYNNPLKFTDPDGEWVHLAVGAAIGGTMNLIMNINNVGNFWQGLGYFGVGAVAGALGAGVGAGIGVAYTGAGTFGVGFMGTATLTSSSLGFVGGFASGFGGGFSSGFVSGTSNSLMGGSMFGQSIKTGLGEGVTQGLIGGGIGGVIGGVSSTRAGNHPLTGKPPYFQAELDNFELVYQNDLHLERPMNCKNATLESIEKMQGGLRTQVDFKREGDLFLKNFETTYGRQARPEEYFEHFGFDIENPAGKSHRFIGNLMKTGNPTVINQNTGGGHTLTITKIRRWTPTSKVKVWFGDPANGIWKTNFNRIVNPSFNLGAYSFILSF